MKQAYCVKVNGYSNFKTGVTGEDTVENFTLVFACTPYTYESCASGILSAFSEREKKGILIGVKKKGIVTVRIGLGEQILELESLKVPMEFQKKNLVTIAFWGTAGWCDLYVNGMLSNRKQFPRHSKMELLAGTYYIGKYVDGEKFSEDTRCGIFHGELEILSFVKEYLDYEKVRTLSCGERKEDDRIDFYETETYKADCCRPVYHLVPPGKWMNEPHAPFYYHGRYHIFYQANPHAPVWDNLCWGHLTSPDMVAWKDAGIALYPDTEGLDIDGCWSGSACMDAAGEPVLFYTAGNNKELPNQSVAVAVPKDKDDPELRVWKKQGVILRQTMGEGFFGEFRDPFVWKQDGCYYILVGSGDVKNGGGNALLYTSIDLKEFEYHGFFVDYEYEKCTEAGHVWELPVLLPLKDQQGRYCCDILLFCACQVEKEIVDTYYFLGRFDKEKKQFCKSHELPGLLDLGCGTFTGPSGFVTEDGRSVVFTIAQGKRNPDDEYQSGWAHGGGMPVELSVRDGELRIAPFDEMRKYFKKCAAAIEIESAALTEPVLIMENLFENRVLVSTKGNDLELVLEWGTDGYVISYNRGTREWKAVSRKTGVQISKIRNEADLVAIGEEAIEVECYIDHSLIELYINQRKGITLRSYAFCESNRFFVKTQGACRVSVWNYGV